MLSIHTPLGHCTAPCIGEPVMRRRNRPAASMHVSKSSEEEKLIKVSLLYPNTEGCKFDMNYYLNQHMPMVQQKLGPACKRMAVEEGIAGGAPGAPATYVAMGHRDFVLTLISGTGAPIACLTRRCRIGVAQKNQRL